jgi:hypothetical protein
MPLSKGAGATTLLYQHPCKDEHQRSLECVSTRSRAACIELFKEYKACMKEWQAQERAAKIAARGG